MHCNISKSSQPIKAFEETHYAFSLFSSVLYIVSCARKRSWKWERPKSGQDQLMLLSPIEMLLLKRLVSCSASSGGAHWGSTVPHQWNFYIRTCKPGCNSTTTQNKLLNLEYYCKHDFKINAWLEMNTFAWTVDNFYIHINIWIYKSCPLIRSDICQNPLLFIPSMIYTIKKEMWKTRANSEEVVQALRWV